LGMPILNMEEVPCPGGWAFLLEQSPGARLVKMLALPLTSFI